ncbi:hypothetical protein IC621_17475 [Bacillus sp. IB182487]|uniref:Uncharacterized protein n=1 Tax=Metabacillus arenae TaxID=2771434 RepID=A0A926RZ97_9BACI|nr:hypothetical protein [Metabacillus arenae]
MEKEQLEFYEKVRSFTEETTQLRTDYWYDYSNLSTWQFWVILLFMFIVPLVVLYFFIDRKKIFLIGFYGFNIHVWFGYIDSWGNNKGLWGYPYELIPLIPGSLSLDAALIPILFMLVYQWTHHHRKNYYLYSIGLSLILSFVLKPILVMHNLFVLHKWVHYYHFFIAYCLVFLFSKLITNIFITMQKKGAN